ncbi:MAG: PAS domain S-box protein [Sulfurifustaceae bacterium]
MRTDWKAHAIERAWLAAIVDSSPDAIIRRSLNMTITSWSRGAERLFGYAAEEVLGRTFAFLCEPGIEWERVDLFERLSGGENVAFFETVRRARDGRRIPVAVTVSVIRDWTGNPVGFVDVERDISDRRNAERALRENERLLHEHRRQLADADRRRGDFLAALSHELRNPLASLSNTVNILCNGMGNKTEEVRWGLELIRRQTERLAYFVNDLLDISRIVRGTLTLRLARVDLNTAVDEAVYEARWFTEQRKQTLTVARSESPIWVEADTRRLTQVFNTLLAHAINGTSEAGRIDVAVERGERHAAVRIRDDGDGISSEELPYIFETLMQTVAGTRVREEVFPVPLVLVRQLVELHGGEVHAASDGPGKGSEFVVQLPLDASSRGG